MKAHTVKSSIDLAISSDGKSRTNTALKTTYLDLDLLSMQLERLKAQHGDAFCIVDSLSFGTGLFKVNLRASLFISNLNELVNFIQNLIQYIEKETEFKTIEQAIAEYVGCYDQYYHDLMPSEVIEVVSAKILLSKPCREVTRKDRENKVRQFENGISVIFTEKA